MSKHATQTHRHEPAAPAPKARNKMHSPSGNHQPVAGVDPLARAAIESNGTPTHEQIAIRAYQIWNAAGRPEGMHEQNWLDAERQLGGRKP
jgi:hypothetical protein